MKHLNFISPSSKRNSISDTSNTPLKKTNAAITPTSVANSETPLSFFTPRIVPVLSVTIADTENDNENNKKISENNISKFSFSPTSSSSKINTNYDSCDTISNNSKSLDSFSDDKSNLRNLDNSFFSSNNLNTLSTFESDKDEIYDLCTISTNLTFDNSKASDHEVDDEELRLIDMNSNFLSSNSISKSSSTLNIISTPTTLSRNSTFIINPSSLIRSTSDSSNSSVPPTTLFFSISSNNENNFDNKDTESPTRLTSNFKKLMD